jgi:outer membrane biogenesis lipoprotein LolB
VTSHSASPDSPRALRRAWAAVACCALLASACAPRLLDLPTGPGEPAADGRSVVAAATAACRDVTSFVAEGAVSGSADGQRVRGRLHLGVAAPASARLEAIAPFGQPLFILVARNGRATLLLTRPDRVLEHDDPMEVLEALTGIPLDAADLLTTLTGCGESSESADVRRLGADWRMQTAPEGDAYFNRESASAAWRLVVRVRRDPGQREWRVEYREFDGAFPTALRFVGQDRNRLDLRIALSQIERNVALGGEAFEVRVPAGARPVTLDELRGGGPLGASDGQ